MKTLSILLITLLNIVAMRAQTQSTSTTFSKEQSVVTTVKDNKVSTKEINTVGAKYESDINPENYKKIRGIIEEKLGEASKKEKGLRIWENNSNKKEEYYIVSLNKYAILVDYSGLNEKSKKRNMILKMIEELEKLEK